jgi:hypothetical protein
MATDHFTQTFGVKSKGKTDELPKATYWLNIGYTIEVETEEGVTETRFISLPVGIPLDTQKLLPTNSQNDVFRELQSARNDLLAQVLDVAKTLDAGEEKIIGEAGGLQIQIRRVNDEKPAIKSANNPFARKLAFAA